MNPKQIWSKNFGSRTIWVQRSWVKKNSLKKLESKRILSKKIRPKNLIKKKNGVKKIFGSCEPIFKVWVKLDWYLLRYSIKFKLGQMLHGQMLTGKTFLRQLTTQTDGQINFG